MSVIYWQGEPIETRDGETVSAVLNRSGIRTLGTGRHFCGIGLCQNCVVFDEAGRPFEACITLARPGMRLVPILSGGTDG
jgi:ferredoxin